MYWKVEVPVNMKGVEGFAEGEVFIQKRKRHNTFKDRCINLIYYTFIFMQVAVELRLQGTL